MLGLRTRPGTQTTHDREAPDQSPSPQAQTGHQVGSECPKGYKNKSHACSSHLSRCNVSPRMLHAMSLEPKTGPPRGKHSHPPCEHGASTGENSRMQEQCGRLSVRATSLTKASAPRGIVVAFRIRPVEMAACSGAPQDTDRLARVLRSGGGRTRHTLQPSTDSLRSR